MDISDRRVWQVGAGDTDRDYGEICLKYDVMIVGPGNPGLYSAKAYSHLGDIKNSIRRFYEAAKGDIVIWRIGTGRVLAVGELADDKPQWIEAFSDVDGWDLQHTRRVRWFRKTERVFPKTTLGTKVRTFAGINASGIHEWIKGLKIDSADVNRKLAKLPRAGKNLNVSELAQRLFIEGMSSEYVDNLSSALNSIRRVATWYQNESKKPDGRPSESETVSYLVIPLLFSLGWSEQTCAIEWKRVDVALFESMPSIDKNLSCVVEVKKLNRSVFNPLGQALSYVQHKNRAACTRLIVTDGIRYVFHESAGQAFEVKAYLNVLEMRDSYALFGCGGAVEAILGMAK